MHSDDALLSRDAEAEGEAVVPRAAVNVESIRTARPEAVVGHVDEEAKDGRLKAEANQAELPAVCVACEHQIAFTHR